MSSNLLSARNVSFLLHEWLDVSELSLRERFAEHSRETYDALLELCEQLATDHFAPHFRKSDENEPSFDGTTVTVIPEVGEALRRFAEMDGFALGADAEAGGLQLPSTVGTAAATWFTAANIGTICYAFLTQANAGLLQEHASAEIRERYVPPMLEGRWFGTMAMSEAHAGSSLGDITTRAVPQDDGSYRIFGSKMWISGGDHELADNIVHLVLARLPEAPAGTKGISLFVVPKFVVEADGSLGEHNDVAIAGINHKLGSRGTVNTAPVFGDGAFMPGGQAGAIGHLVGEPHKGLKYMFHMMNAARLAVGTAATGTAYAAYLKSLEYARERPQGRDVATTDQAAPQVAIIEHTDVRRMLLAQKAYVEGALALTLYCARQLDEERSAPTEEERAEAAKVLGVLTPIVKSWPSQWGQESTSLAIQVLGGAGYTRDHDVEQHWRDQRLNPIHEGTHGIQAMDLLGRKVLLDGGAGLMALAARIEAAIARAHGVGGRCSAWGDQLKAQLDRFGEVTFGLAGLGEPETILANATAYLEAAGHLVVAWLWLEQALVAEGNEGDFYDGKRQAAAYFFATELPKITPMLDLLASGDLTSLEMRESWF
ncbi:MULTISPECIES: acyl-CoA dehydrogenase [unclassified Nocardioides]|uniref:acyl-CoA dehydrogenase n=1 Tax=unclassified Nocardioides TaxID=2615069 RepID=UPI0007027FE2|nr:MULTISPECIES: acyl-CoA dehydrogenase [unclassified Nocardioides]KRC54075.1 acyl-CoA dehydrogenase [Nocardioides sp. Root79]KRC71411.1 acyl-CoA dehydrogenase [Nocardioides sp. Root240]